MNIEKFVYGFFNRLKEFSPYIFENKEIWILYLITLIIYSFILSFDLINQIVKDLFVNLTFAISIILCWVIYYVSGELLLAHLTYAFINLKKPSLLDIIYTFILKVLILIATIIVVGTFCLIFITLGVITYFLVKDKILFILLIIILLIIMVVLLIPLGFILDYIFTNIFVCFLKNKSPKFDFKQFLLFVVYSIILGLLSFGLYASTSIISALKFLFGWIPVIGSAFIALYTFITFVIGAFLFLAKCYFFIYKD
jgi:hypothetical protein